MSEWAQFLRDWTPIGAVIGSLFFAGRQLQRQTRWKKTEFLLQLGERFDNDPGYQRAYQLVWLGLEMPEGSDLHKILLGSNPSPREARLRVDIDRYLDFFDRLAYAVEDQKSLSMKDIGSFKWYIRHVAHTDALREYANKNGYHRVLQLAEKATKTGVLKQEELEVLKNIEP